MLGDDHGRTRGAQVQEHIAQEIHRLRGQVRCGLVEQMHPGVHDHGGRAGDELLLTAGEAEETGAQEIIDSRAPRRLG